MRKREKESLVRKVLELERHDVAKLVCPLCRHDVERFWDGKSGSIHQIKVTDDEVSGMWVECFASKIINRPILAQLDAKQEPK